jgi:hypothetical protein
MAWNNALFHAHWLAINPLNISCGWPFSYCTLETAGHYHIGHIRALCTVLVLQAIFFFAHKTEYQKRKYLHHFSFLKAFSTSNCFHQRWKGGNFLVFVQEHWWKAIFLLGFKESASGRHLITEMLTMHQVSLLMISWFHPKVSFQPLLKNIYKKAGILKSWPVSKLFASLQESYLNCFLVNWMTTFPPSSPPISPWKSR